MYRTHLNHELRPEQLGETVTLCGWVHRRRDHGGLIFIDLRDRYGLTQVVFDPEHHLESHKAAESLRSEFVIQISGNVRQRPEGQENGAMETGQIEVIVDEVTNTNKSKMQRAFLIRATAICLGIQNLLVAAVLQPVPGAVLDRHNVGEF